MITRRTFIRTAALSGAVLFSGSSAVFAVTTPKSIIAEAGGVNPYAGTVKAVERIGGMSAFVTKNAKVALLINSPFRNPGTYAKPLVALALVKMCLDAGAKEVVSLKGESGGYWNRMSLNPEQAELVKAVKAPGGHKAFHLKNPERLKKADAVRDLVESDVYISVSVGKNHEGTLFSGTMKNMMGALTHSTNRFFHYGDKGGGWYDNPDHIAECVIDINHFRKPDLAVLDCTEMITTNGPWGPGDLVRPGKIIVGSDPVAVDTYGAKLLGLDPAKVGMLNAGARRGLGESNLGNIKILSVGA